MENVSECTNEDFRYELRRCAHSIGLPYKADQLLQLDVDLNKQLQQQQANVDAGAEIVAEQLHEAAIATLAKFTAHSIQASFHVESLSICF